MLRRSTDTIVNQVASLKRMVDDFREYARTPPAQMQPIDLNALLAEVLTLYGWDPNDASGAASSHGAHFGAQLADDLPPIQGDPAQLRQVIHNLLANARDAACQHHPDGGAEIRVQTRLIRPESEPDHVSVRLSVSDNGPGFATEVLPRVFEPYVTTKATGTGLGLAIVKKIVEEHGARVDISNRAEGGARISILFTRLDEARQAQDNSPTEKV
jgi:nitrogen fixation/metabolism regulation signal transduction histidine kinase